MPKGRNKGNYVFSSNVRKPNEEKNNDWAGFFIAIATIIVLLVLISFMV
jgi:hypothetical protein